MKGTSAHVDLEIDLGLKKNIILDLNAKFNCLVLVLGKKKHKC
jgi:hypothetical protein